jgi:hypothetical protein
MSDCVIREPREHEEVVSVDSKEESPVLHPNLEPKVDPRVKDLAGLVMLSMNWTQPAAHAMRVVTEIHQIKGMKEEEKVKLAQEVFTYVANEMKLEGMEKTAAFFFIEHVLPHVHDATHFAMKNPVIRGAVEVVQVSATRFCFCW